MVVVGVCVCVLCVSVCVYTQELLDTPNPNSPAQSDAYMMFTQDLQRYKKEVKKQTGNYPPPT